MKDDVKMGLNRTGISSSKGNAKALQEAAARTQPTSMGDEHGIAEVRESYMDGSTVGSVPPPPSAKGLGKAAMQALKGENAPLLIDKLGERLAFERTGVRLYDALLSKLEKEGTWQGGPTRAELEQIRAEELAHFHLVTDAIEHLGGDPTVETPSADVVGVASSGIPQVLADPRVALRQSLDAILMAELADNASWEVLVELTDSMGQDELKKRFEGALRTEARHLTLVKKWLAAGLSAKAGTEVRA